MEKKTKVSFLKEKQIKKKAKERLDFYQNEFAQNPIKAKFKAFQNTKNEINIKDLL